MKLITRDTYLNKINNVKGTPDIKVITGIRRSGKSKLLEAFKGHLEENLKENNIIHINFNMPEYGRLQNSAALYEYVNSCFVPNKENFVLIDEVQMCNGFETAINGLHASEKFDIYVTGSNAFLLSSDLATLFTGRTFEIKVFPFSFAEYIQYFGGSEKFALFDKYMIEGGMSGSYLYNEPEDKLDYIADVFNTLITRDIRQKYNIRNFQLMDRVTDFLIDNISNLTSARGIASVLNNSKENTNHVTIGAYLEYLCNAFAFYKVRKYDIKGKKYLLGNDKYYLSDHSFRYAKLDTKNIDTGRVIENIIAIELLRRGYELYAGALYNKEIDFVAIKRGEKTYIQVADNISDEETFKREVSPLLQIKDAYPKMLIARTRQEDFTFNGVKIIDAANYLLN